jgi:hypothetical protein
MFYYLTVNVKVHVILCYCCIIIIVIIIMSGNAALRGLASCRIYFLVRANVTFGSCILYRLSGTHLRYKAEWHIIAENAAVCHAKNGSRAASPHAAAAAKLEIF